MFFFTCVIIACVFLIAGIVNSPMSKLIQKTSYNLDGLSIQLDKTSFFMFFLAVLVVIIGFAAGPYINLWQAEIRGRAILAEAVGAKQAKIEEARAAKESAIHLKDAEITRAQGVEEANRIIAQGLGGPEGYLRYLFIESLKETSNNPGSSVIYIPTEAGLPILEAQRLAK